MNNKRTIERKATIALTAFLVGMFCYQVVYGTNESSYKYGYKQGKDEFTNCKDSDADCTAAPDDCQSPVVWNTKNETTGYYSVEHRSYDIMTNQTACMDGYSQGWEHSCKNNGIACVLLFKNYGFLPDASIVSKINGTWYRCDVFRTDNGLPCGDTGGTRSPIFKVNGTVTNNTQYWAGDGRGGWFGWN